MKKRLVIFGFLFIVFTTAVYPQFFENNFHIISSQLSVFEYISGDLNNDGVTDVLTSSWKDGLVCLARSKDHIGFVPQIIDSSLPSHLIVTDIDNDQDNDIIGSFEAHQAPWDYHIVIYYNDGKGHFEKQLFQVEQAVEYLTVGDLDADKFKDILMLGNDGYLYFFINPGLDIDLKKAPASSKIKFRTGFQIEREKNSPGNLLSITDMNNDRLNDIVLGYGNYVYLLFNKGNNEFEDPIVFNFQKDINQMTVYDYNNDGYKDILVKCSDGLYLHISDKQNNFIQTIFVLKSARIVSYEVNDLNGDGYPDILFNERYKTGWYKNTQDFIFQRVIIHEENENENKQFVNTLGFDYDGDDMKDLVCFARDHYNVFRNINGGTFKPFLTRNDMRDVTCFCVGDFDGSNAKDIIAIHKRNLNMNEDIPSGIFIFKNYQESGFEISEKISEDQGSIIRSGDINQDGYPDFVICDENSPDGKYYLQWYENNGDASFIKHKANSPFDQRLTDFALIDYDNDGYLDIVGIAYAYDNYLFWLRNNEGKDFKEPQVLYTGYLQQLTYLYPEDFTGNGYPDFIIMGEYHKLFFLKNKDGKSFEEEPIGPEKKFNNFTVADLDNDGKNDIIVNVKGDKKKVQTGWYRNMGDGRFSDFILAGIINTRDDNPFSRTFAADINVDGAIDLITETSDTVYYYMNNGAGDFGLQEKNPVGFYNAIQSFTDLDDDDDPDMISYLKDDFFFESPQLVWFKNRHNTKANLYWSICKGDSINLYGNWISEPGNYIVEFNSQNNGDSLFILQLDVFPNNITSFDISGEATPEQNKMLEYFVTPEIDSLSYFWDIENGTIENLFFQTQATVKWDNTGPGRLKVTAIDLKTKCTKQKEMNVSIQKSQQNDFTVYPNPAVEIINLPSVSDTIYTEIFNINGSMVKTSDKSVIYVSDLPAGVYILKMFNKTGKLLHTKKIVIR
ncbi:MAG: T9SS type A sorting domain-containing protein [Chlorobi bacterium]|nr:T9SS type A sorting domain-containing protein [Chlorobiota bacterium]